MARGGPGQLRRRGSPPGPASLAGAEDTEKPVKGMAGWWSRLFYPYRVLLVFSLLVCLLQILVGISFFNNSRGEEEPGPSKAAPPPAPPPDPVAAPHTENIIPCNLTVTSKEVLSAVRRAST